MLELGCVGAFEGKGLDYYMVASELTNQLMGAGLVVKSSSRADSYYLSRKAAAMFKAVKTAAKPKPVSRFCRNLPPSELSTVELMMLLADKGTKGQTVTLFNSIVNC